MYWRIIFLNQSPFIFQSLVLHIACKVMAICIVKGMIYEIKDSKNLFIVLSHVLFLYRITISLNQLSLVSKD